MEDPVGYLITWVTYGTWLPGDSRGWVEYMGGWHSPNPKLEAATSASMKEDECRLTKLQRDVVESRIEETCERRGW